MLEKRPLKKSRSKINKKKKKPLGALEIFFNGKIGHPNLLKKEIVNGLLTSSITFPFRFLRLLPGLFVYFFFVS
jgi:hypothetical protein